MLEEEGKGHTGILIIPLSVIISLLLRLWGYHDDYTKGSKGLLMNKWAVFEAKRN